MRRIFLVLTEEECEALAIAVEEWQNCCEEVARPGGTPEDEAADYRSLAAAITLRAKVEEGSGIRVERFAREDDSE